MQKFLNGKSPTAAAEGEPTGISLPPVAETAPERRVHEPEDEERWMKKTNGTVSLPSLTQQGPRPTMWQRAEGQDCSSPVNNEEDSWLRRTIGTVHMPLLRSTSRVRFSTQDEVQVQEDSCRGAVPEAVSKAAALFEKRSKKLKRVDLYAREHAHLEKHRQLKTTLRDQRHLDRSLSCSRHLVEKPIPKGSKDKCRKLLDQQFQEQLGKRIENHITGCSNARQELMEMQRKMALVCPPPPSEVRVSLMSDLKGAFADVLHRPHAAEVM